MYSVASFDAENGTNAFDLSRLRLSGDLASSGAVKKLLTTVPRRKPNRQEFVRVRPGEDHKIETWLLEIKDDRDLFLVDPEVALSLPGEVAPYTLHTAINRQGNLFLWPTRLPSEDGRLMAWHRTAAEAAKRAETNWIRMAANMSAGYYDTWQALGDLGEPSWPEENFEALLKIAFADSFIRDFNHPILQRLRGEA